MDSVENLQMMADSPKALGERLGPLFAMGFFRPLARPSAPIYVDCAERLAAGSDEAGQLSPGDSQAIIREVLVAHPATPLAEDEGASFLDLRQRAGQFYNRLLEAGWLQTRVVSLDERWVLLSPFLRHLLTFLHDLAQSEVVELKDFAATVRSICDTLLAEGVLNPTRHSGEELRQTVKELLDRLERAGNQMHAVETLVLRQEEQQRTSVSAGETLQRFLVDFHEGEHMVCYDALEKTGLLPRLRQARQVVQEALADPVLKLRLSESLSNSRAMEDSVAYVEAERMLLALDGRIAAIPRKQRIVDGRIADFSRLSAARYRYQTEMSGRRPEEVRAWMQGIDRVHAGAAFSDLSSEPGLTLLSPEVELYFGRDALATGKKRRLPVDLSVAPPSDAEDTLDAQSFIRERTRDAVTPERGVRLVERLLPEKGGTASTADFHLNSDDVIDLFAALAFDHGVGGQGRTTVRWKIHTERENSGVSPEGLTHDVQGDYRIERITIERVA